MNDSIKRVQSQAGLSFAERENQRSAAGGKANLRPEVKQKDFMKSAGRRGYSPLARVMTLAVMLLTLATTGAWAQEGTLLTTITPDGNGNPVYTVADVATLDKGGADYSSDWGWNKGGQAWLTITPAANVTITKVKFTTNAGDSWEDTEAPFQAKLDGLWVFDDKGNNMDNGEGVTKIEVYGYQNAPAGDTKYTVTMAEGTVDATNWTISPTEAAEGKPITATYSGTKHVKSVTAVVKAAAPAYTMAAAATDADKGKLICADGHIHANGEDAECTKARVAKIIYLGTTGHATYTHGLALALTDEGQMAWEAAKTACNTTKNTSTPVTDATWLLASKAQWDYMLNGAGGTTSLRDGFSGITGASNLVSGFYWSSTEKDASTAWRYWFYEGNWNDAVPKDHALTYARACLAF